MSWHSIKDIKKPVRQGKKGKLQRAIRGIWKVFVATHLLQYLENVPVQGLGASRGSGTTTHFASHLGAEQNEHDSRILQHVCVFSISRDPNGKLQPQKHPVLSGLAL